LKECFAFYQEIFCKIVTFKLLEKQWIEFQTILKRREVLWFSVVNEVIRDWYSNFLDEVVSVPHRFPKVTGIDEVVSGASVIRCLKNVDLASEKKRREIRQDLVQKAHARDPTLVLDAIRQADLLSDNTFATELAQFRNRTLSGDYVAYKDLVRLDSHTFVDILKQALGEKLVYRTIGIEDSKMRERNKEYEEAKVNGRITPVKVESIITMDRPEYCPPRFALIAGLNTQKTRLRFKPAVQDFVVTPQYVEFLGDLARYVGKDPTKVSPVNMTQILGSSKYLSPKFR